MAWKHSRCCSGTISAQSVLATRTYSITTTRRSIDSGAAPIDNDTAVRSDAMPTLLPATKPLLAAREEGQNFGKINDTFVNWAAKGFFTIHGGRLHHGVGPANFNPLAERKPLYLKSVEVFASMVDVPVSLPWSDSAIPMWEKMESLESYQMDSVMRKRARKMNKHKHRKKLKESRFLRRKLKKA
jgi:hypothetical protein